MSSWPVKPFGELTENFDSVRVPVKESERKPGPYPYYGASGVVDRVDGYLFDGEYLLVAEDGENLKTRQTPIAFIATGKFWVNNHAHIVRASKNNVTRYLMYAMREADIASFLTGSTMPKLTQGNMNRVLVVAPPRETQKAIAHILGSLDDKIELNRRMNDTLEAMARALFKSWFVDFDPVRAKAEGRAPSGMHAETSKMFPSEFVESELGEIPKGWRVTKLGDVLELKRGYDLPAAQRLSGTVPIISSSGPSGLHSEAKASAPGIVTGRYGTIGLVFYVREDFWPLNTTLYVRDFKGTDALYAYHLLRLVDFRKFSDKAAVPGVNRNHLHEEAVVAPPLPVQQRFTSFASAWLDLAAQCIDQARVLTSVRDALLPRLLSGEMTVASAERAVGDVA